MSTLHLKPLSIANVFHLYNNFKYFLVCENTKYFQLWSVSNSLRFFQDKMKSVTYLDNVILDSFIEKEVRANYYSINSKHKQGKFNYQLSILRHKQQRLTFLLAVECR